jgi:2'-5' RNA ligase
VDKEPQERRVLVDLDGTLTIGKGHGPYDFSPIATGAEAFLKELHEMFDEVVICTARCELGAVKNFMRQAGLAKYINDYTSTKLPAKLIVEDRSVVHRGDFAETLKAIRGFSPWWESKSNVDKTTKYEFASTQMDLPESLSAAIISMSAKIPDGDLAEKGREKDPHVTVLYGIKDESPDKLREGLRGFGTVRIRLKETSHFEVKDKGFDVLKVGVQSQDIHRLRKKIEGLVDFESDYPDYQPHATIAYLKLGLGKGVSGNRSLAGLEAVFDMLTFSGRNGEITKISLR